MNLEKQFWTKLVVVIALSIIVISIYGEVISAKAYSTSLAVLEIDQFKDSTMLCTAPTCQVPNNAPHPIGDAPTCAYCGTYCVPASILMIAEFYHGVGLFSEDQIYDQGKHSQGEIQANGQIETFGVGMYDGTGGFSFEVQASFSWAVDPSYTEFNSSKLPITEVEIKLAINNNHPLLWLDHNGWPTTMPWTAIDTAGTEQGVANNAATIENYQGHAKVIIGYDDLGNAIPTDDIFYYLDPWPDPTTTGTLNATYSQIMDSADIFIVKTIALDEFIQNIASLIISATFVLIIILVKKKEFTA